MSTIRNNLVVGLRRADVIIMDELDDVIYGPRSFGEYEMVRLGPKHYGFRPKNDSLHDFAKSYPHSRALTKTYRCSRIKARELFKVYLVANRLKT
jgi:hypothetical protein